MERWYRLANRFGGFDWEVKAGVTGPRGNTFFREHVVEEPNGELSIIMDQRADGTWGCAELRTRQKLHFGRYELVVEGDLGQLADNMAVFGFFNYPAAGDAPDGSNEIDVEIAQFAPPNNLNFTLYPKNGGAENSAKHQLALPRSGQTTFVFDWGDQHLDWQALADGSVLAGRSLDGADVHQVPDIWLPLRINIWLLHDQTPALDTPSRVRLVDLAYAGPAPDPLAEDDVTIVGLTDGQIVDNMESDIAIETAPSATNVSLEVLTDTWYPQDPAVALSPGRFSVPVARFYTRAGTTIPVRAKAEFPDGEVRTSALIDVIKR